MEGTSPSAWCTGESLFRAGCLRGRSSLRTGDVDTAPEVGAVLNDDSGGFHVADQVRALAKNDPLIRFDISLNRAGDDHFQGFDAGIRLSVGADGQAVLRFQLAFHFAFDAKLVFTENVALDPHGLPDQGAVAYRTRVARRGRTGRRSIGSLWTWTGRTLIFIPHIAQL
jgi:hypothetical protein